MTTTNCIDWCLAAVVDCVVDDNALRVPAVRPVCDVFSALLSVVWRDLA